ncbi:MAG: manganese/iron transporter, family [Variovorax sp.]|nr:manganese/iron transporter, family [Variovorax sp.]
MNWKHRRTGEKSTAPSPVVLQLCSHEGGRPAALLNPTLAGPPRRSRATSLFGPGALVAIGYMDPGNWATAVSGGARYGYALLFVVVLASLVAMLLQSIAARVGVVTGRDLAQLCRERLPRRSILPLWVASELAIVACDVAEVVGSAVALQLLFGMPMWLGVLVAAAATLVFFAVRRRGDRALAWLVAALIVAVGVCLAAQLSVFSPDWRQAGRGLVPDPSILRDGAMLWLAAGIVGATVMPHNLYLHSALVKHHALDSSGLGPRASPCNNTSLRRILRNVGLDSVAALSFAFLINAALLMLAASVFHAQGWTRVDDLAEAHRLFSTELGARWPGVLFALALLICGLNSMLSGTLAGQVVMEGFLKLEMSAFKRALLTRGLAIGPAMLAVTVFGETGSAALMVTSQVMLSLQLPFAMVPLLYFANDRSLMGEWTLRPVTSSVAWICAAALTLLGAGIVWQLLG